MTKDNSNVVFYVSDMYDLPEKGHFIKMDCGKEIAERIGRGLNDCMVRKYTSYQGEEIESGSVGIVFPAHRWGVSLAVLSFLNHLRVKRGTYVYAVAVGESLSGSVKDTVIKRVKILEQFKRIFAKKGLGDNSDIFVRCIDVKRETVSTEEELRKGLDGRDEIKNIMTGLLFCSIESITSDKVEILDGHGYYEAKNQKNVEQKPERTETMAVSGRMRLGNIFLDDELMSEVRLCRVM